MKTVYVGMSGGVDSSLSAVLLKEQGYHVVGVYMKNWSRDLPGMKCPWASDLADAKRVAVKLGIDFKVFDVETDYKQKVVDYMLSEFARGRTPNPDIMCNQEIKFKLFYETAMEDGADLIATGHYARVFNDEVAKLAAVGSPLAGGISPEDTPALLKAVDENKDQTYFLYRISKEAIEHTIFPIGGMLKPDVKKLAAEKGLDNAYKKESMGVCFVGEVGMEDFLKQYFEEKAGDIIDAETGEKLGMHNGAIFYSIGQRHGLDLGGGLPYYVVKKDVQKNIVYVSRNLNSKDLWTDELELEDILIRQAGDPRRAILGWPENGVPPEEAFSEGKSSLGVNFRDRTPKYPRDEPACHIQVRLRHRAELIPAVLEDNKLKFEKPVKKPASGQSAVFYDGDICLGGGIIV